MIDNLAKPAAPTGSNSEFQLGIVMAGAVSAGAYSAGVMDFIIEALDAYEAAKLKEDWDGPIHDVRVPVLAGASAGGMTSAIVALNSFHDLVHVWPDRPLPPPEANRLYSSWVTDISIERLLDTTDLGKHGDPHVKSALCCDVLTEIVNNAFKLAGRHERAWVGCGDDHSLAVLRRDSGVLVQEARCRRCRHRRKRTGTALRHKSHRLAPPIYGSISTRLLLRIVHT
jgi:hypothetical protein